MFDELCFVVGKFLFMFVELNRVIYDGIDCWGRDDVGVEFVFI